MRKIIYSVLITFAGLLFFSCAPLLNDKYPEEAVSLSKTAQAGYTEDSRKPIISATSVGELNEQTSEIIYTFETFGTTNNYNISWENRTGKIMVSVSKYEDFRSCLDGFENITSGNRDISISGRSNIYLRVKIAPYYTTEARYLLKISGQVGILQLTKLQ